MLFTILLITFSNYQLNSYQIINNNDKKGANTQIHFDTITLNKLAFFVNKKVFVRCKIDEVYYPQNFSDIYYLNSGGTHGYNIFGIRILKNMNYLLTDKDVKGKEVIVFGTLVENTNFTITLYDKKNLKILN